METQVLQEKLNKALSICSRFSTSKVQLPVLSHLHLVAEDARLLISATNLESSISMAIGAKTKEKGDIAIPARTISEIVGNLGKGSIDLFVEGESMQIVSEGFKSTVLGMNASDFPTVPSSLTETLLDVPREAFFATLGSILFSVSTDEARPVLTGVLVLINDGGLTLISTDGFRLSKKLFPVSYKGESRKVIIPKSALSELSRVFNDSENLAIHISDKENQILFGDTSCVFVSRVIDGDFPDIEAKIKSVENAATIKALVGKDDFMRAIKLASVLARMGGNIIKLLVKKDSVVVQTDSSQSGTLENTIPAKVEIGETDELSIGFNYRFLEEYVNVVKGSDIELSMSLPNSPVLLKDVSDPDFLHVIMPVRLQNE